MNSRTKTLLVTALAFLAASLVAALVPSPARALDAMVNGGLHHLVINAHPTTGAVLINESTQQGIGNALTSRSGTIAAANVSQQLMAANAARRGFMVQNSGAAVLWINELGSAATTAQPSIQVAVGATYVSPPNAASPTAINIIGGTLSQAFTAREW